MKGIESSFEVLKKKKMKKKRKKLYHAVEGHGLPDELHDVAVSDLSRRGCTAPARDAASVDLKRV